MVHELLEGEDARSPGTEMLGGERFTSRVTDAWKRSWQRPVRSAQRSVVTAGDPFELFGQPNPLQRPQSTQGGRSP